MTVGIGIPDEEIWRISRARNTSEKVPLYALRELAGDWSILKAHINPTTRALVALKPNDPEAQNAEYDITALVKRLALVNNEMFPAERGAHPKTAYTSIGTLVRKYTPEKFLKVASLLPDVLDLEERVVRHWEEKNGRGPGKIGITKASGCSPEPTVLLSGYRSSISLADPFVLLVVAAFRVFVQKDGTWARPVDVLFVQYGPRTVETLWDAYKELGKSSAAVFGRQKTAWSQVCQPALMAAIQDGLVKVA